MNKRNNERIKSLIIGILVALSLIQVGILWEYQSHRLPISIFSELFGFEEPAVSNEMARNDLFVPNKIIISSGDASHWLINKGNELFIPLWNEAKQYLSDIAKGKLVPVDSDDKSLENDWGDITTKMGYVFEFKIDIQPDLLNWFLGIDKSAIDIHDVAKMMVVPDTVNTDSCMLYIYTGEGKVIKYESNNYMKSKSISDIQEIIQNDKSNTYREYSTIRDNKLDSYGKWAVEPDILYVVNPPKYWPYNNITCAIPAKMVNSDDNLDDIATIVLGSDKERYTIYKYDDGTIQFINNYNVYKVYSDGLLEYKYTSDTDSTNKGKVGDALYNAYKFINRIKKLINIKADILLAEVDESKKGYYSFKFNYYIEGMPIYLKFSPDIEINANSVQVLGCNWIIRDFSLSGKNNYNDRITDIMVNADPKYMEIHMKDILVGYVVKSKEDKLLRPSMIIEDMKNSSIQALDMPMEKGD